MDSTNTQAKKFLGFHPVVALILFTLLLTAAQFWFVVIYDLTKKYTTSVWPSFIFAIVFSAIFLIAMRYIYHLPVTLFLK